MSELSEKLEDKAGELVGEIEDLDRQIGELLAKADELCTRLDDKLEQLQILEEDLNVTYTVKGIPTRAYHVDYAYGYYDE